MLETEARREALARLGDGLGTRAPFLLVIGEAGTGKTGLVRDAVAAWGARAVVAFVANAAMSRTELVEQVARRFGAEPPANATKPQLLECLEGHIAQVAEQGQVPVIVIDDAHELTADLLGELRLLVNAAVDAGRSLEVVLVGFPALETLLADPALAPVRQRIAVRCVLSAFSPPETRRYLHEVLGATLREGPGYLPKKACREIHERTGGVPRAVQTLANEAIRRAHEASAPLVTVEHVQAAVAALGLGSAPAAGAAPSARAAPVERSRVSDDERPARASASAAAPGEDAGPRASAPVSASPASDDARVQAWVGNFIKPGEPKFGELLKSGRPRAIEFSGPSLDTLFDDLEAGASGDAETGAVTTPKPIIRPRPPRPRGRRVGGGTSSRTRMADSRWVILAGTVLIVIAAALLMWLRSRPVEPESEAATVATGREPSSEVAPATKGSASKRAARKATDPGHERASGSTTPPAGATDAPAAAPGQLYALDVGMYLDRDRAAEERDRLVAATGLKGWLVYGSRGGVEMVRVVLGTYRSQERASVSAETLLDRGLVAEALVIPLPPRSQRY